MSEEVIRDVPPNRVGRVVQDLVEDDTVEVEATRAPDGSWIVTGRKQD